MDRKYYVLCDSNCKFESMTKEQIFAAITQAVNERKIGDIDTGFVTTVKTINGTPLKFFVGTQSEYELLSASQKENLFAIITNDTSKESMLATLEEIRIAQESTNATVANILEELSVRPRYILRNSTEYALGDNRLIADLYEDEKSFVGRTFEIVTNNRGNFIVKFNKASDEHWFKIDESNICIKCETYGGGGNNLHIYVETGAGKVIITVTEVWERVM